MEKNTLRFDAIHINCDNFKQKDITTINEVIKGTRIGDVLKFNSYAEITFDENDKMHLKPIVMSHEKFNKKKTNCIVYNVFDNKKYDRIYYYNTVGKIHSYYGFVLHNTKTKKSLHKYFLANEVDNLITTTYRALAAS